MLNAWFGQFFPSAHTYVTSAQSKKETSPKPQQSLLKLPLIIIPSKKPLT